MRRFRAGLRTERNIIDELGLEEEEGRNDALSELEPLLARYCAERRCTKRFCGAAAPRCSILCCRQQFNDCTIKYRFRQIPNIALDFQ
ncbi:unnamed protein product [Anisakis simplex]|uniref:HIT-type domain-containing protein n=1 Tax=Anisakis simplex TaxID=6269 RepID=A0A0M3J8D0_ANISI|nr:unnamed protein product [Anisakis simplex]